MPFYFTTKLALGFLEINYDRAEFLQPFQFIILFIQRVTGDQEETLSLLPAPDSAETLFLIT